MRKKTLKQLQWLSKNRNKAPAEQKAAFDEVLSDIDIYAAGSANRATAPGGRTWPRSTRMPRTPHRRRFFAPFYG